MPRFSSALAAFAASTLCCATALPVRAADEHPRDAIERLPADIHSVQMCGSWRTGGDAGSHRIVVTDADDGSGAAVYVQWVREAVAGRPAEVLHTKPIHELAEGHGPLSIESVRCITQGKGSSLEIRGLIEGDASPRVHAWMLTLLPGGGYEVREEAR